MSLAHCSRCIYSSRATAVVWLHLWQIPLHCAVAVEKGTLIYTLIGTHHGALEITNVIPSIPTRTHTWLRSWEQITAWRVHWPYRVLCAISPPPKFLGTCCSVHCGKLICFAGVPGGQHGAVQPFSDEDASVETLSHCSSFSDPTSVAEEGRSVLCINSDRFLVSV